MFYGWIIVGVTFVVQLTMMFTVYYSFSVLQKPMVADLSPDGRFGISFVIPVMGIAGAGLAPFIGQLLDRGRARSLMVVGALVTSVGFLLLSRVTTMSQFYAVFCVPLALGMALCGGIASPTLIANWFVTRRGIALGISGFGISASGIVASYVTTALVESVGWRGAVQVFAAFPLFVILPLVALLVVDRPERRGLFPDGADAPPKLETVSTGEHWTLRRALREMPVWIIALGVGLNFTCNGTMVIIAHAYATDSGYTPLQGAHFLALMATMGALGKPLFGYLGDRISLRPAFWICVFLQMAGTALIATASSFPLLLFSGLVFGLGFGGLMPLQGLLVGAAYGREAFGRIMGLLQPPSTLLGLVLGIPLANWLFDTFQSYQPAFVQFLVLYAASAVIMLALRLPDRG